MSDFRERSDAEAPATPSRRRLRIRRAHADAANRGARRTVLPLAAGLVAGVTVFALVSGGVVTDGQSAAAASSSAVTVTAKQQDAAVDTAPMPDLSVTVSQTRGLVAQGIRLDWTGGKKSTAPSAGGNGGENFLQVFMCWGDDPSNTQRPDRTTCQYGGAGSIGATRDAYRNYASIDDVPEADVEYTAPGSFIFPPYTSIPFIARDGTRVDSIKRDATTGKKTIDSSVDVNANQFFTSYTTNEIPWVGSGDDGKGSVTFEVQTAVQSNGLGCGNPVTTSGVTVGASCWLVILPRGTSDNGSTNITQSGLFADSWQHALSVKLDFAPVGTGCAIGQTERQVAGSELAALAVASWQPVVCNQTGGSVYSLITSAESDALLSASKNDQAPLALTSYALSTEGKDPLTYAPVALSGVAISVAIDRLPNPNDKTVPQEWKDKARTPFSSVNLTPRLLAKLLSYSYRSSIPTGADQTYLTGTNEYNITRDPDFLAVNDPEWQAQDLQGAAIADVIVPQGRSDAARAVWKYISSDKDAMDFLASKPDPWGMIVNPWYSTDADVNPTKVPFSLDRDDFPKADPVEVVPANQAPINLVTWRPYANDLSAIAYLTLRGDGQGPGQWDPNSIPPKYGKNPRMLPGSQRLLGLTSAAAAARFQVVTASLRNPAGTFTAPSSTAMRAAADVMTPAGAGDRVVAFDPTSSVAAGARDAYPLTMPVYAATNATLTDPTLRAAYANLVRFAVGTQAQTPGTAVGELPEGYVALPAAWIEQAKEAADVMQNGPQPTASPAPSSGGSYIPSQQAAASTGVVSSGSSGAASAPVAPAATESTPAAATGASSGALAGGKTPDDPDGGAIGAALPISVLAGLVSAVGVPLITRLRRRVT
ncbi:MAG: hypothetical protein IJO71_11800 [Microbacterium sp.]|uniref:hypothetical protein n=1 Tax=Microbacterium sp. TaxID=51671 RepID=UPI0025FCE52C|nr:hypothetical protein [Microbacterium sp.]MBQ9917866.1 hypothetical protein [Microbacterium sp.]